MNESSSDRVVATVLLPISVDRFAKITELLVAEHGDQLRARQDGEFLVFFDGAPGRLRPRLWDESLGHGPTGTVAG